MHHLHPMFEHLPEATKRRLDPHYRDQAEREDMDRYLRRLEPLMHQMVAALGGSDLAKQAREVFAQVRRAHRTTLNRFLNLSQEDRSLRYEEYKTFGHSGTDNDAPFVMGAAAMLVFARKAHAQGLRDERSPQKWSALVLQAAEVCRGEYATLSRLLHDVSGTVRFRENG